MGNIYVISAYKHGTLIKGVQNLGLDPKLQQILSSGSGAVDSSFVSVGQIGPEITFDATAIKTALKNIGGITGAALSSDTFYFQKMAAGSTRGGASTNIKVVAASGIIIPTQLRSPQGREATIGYRAVPVSSNGTSSPIAMTTGQSLETGQDQVSEIYTLGPVTINGIALPGVEDITLDFGINLEIITADGGVYPIFAGIMSRVPFLTVRTLDVDTFESWDLDGVAQGQTASTIVLQDQTQGGIRGSAPITFTVNAGMAHFEDIRGAHGQRIGGSVRIAPTADGTHDIIAITGIN
jgi:hypothetical protein